MIYVKIKNFSFAIQFLVLFKIEDDKKDLARYIAKIVGVNSSDKPKKDKKADKEAEKFKSIIASFSNPKLDEILGSYYFKKIIKFVANGTLPNSEVECYDHLLEIGSKIISKDVETYKELFLNIVKRCK